MFTIEVGKKERDEEFDFEDVRKKATLTHQECFGGKVKWKDEMVGWIFQCQRCGSQTFVGSCRHNKARETIIKTAIDGQERNLEQEEDREVIRVVQKK